MTIIYLINIYSCLSIRGKLNVIGQDIPVNIFGVTCRYNLLKLENDTLPYLHLVLLLKLFNYIYT